MQNLVHMNLEAYVSALGSKSPVPGGGGTAALAGALSAALGQMVGSLTVGKKKYAAVEEEMQRALAEAKALSESLLSLVDRDAEAFEPLSKAYGLPKDTEEEKAVREQIMETCLHDAAEVPFAILETLAKVTPLLSFFAANGSVRRGPCGRRGQKRSFECPDQHEVHDRPRARGGSLLQSPKALRRDHRRRGYHLRDRIKPLSLIFIHF